MLTVGLIYLTLISTCYLVGLRLAPKRTGQCWNIARSSLFKMMPLLLAIFLLVGLFQVFLPATLIEHWLGQTSGVTSLLIGGLAGAVAIGPPIAAFPLAGSLLKAGAWPPAVAAFIVSWISVGIVTLPFEASVFGARFALARNGIAFVSALLIGLLLGSVW